MADIATLGIAVDSSDVTNANRALVSLTNTASGAVSAVKGLVGAWAGWHVVKSIIVESAQLNARFETMGVVLNVVGRNAGYSATQMAGYEQSLRKTGIAMIEARETLTRMSQAQLDLSKTSALARVAQDAAVVGGINSSAAFERMVQGIRSGEVEILRTIGINVSFQQSYEKTAKELGKNVTALTEAEKSQSRMNAVLEEGAKLSGVYEAAMGTAGKQMQSMKRYTDDLKVKFGEVFNETLTMAVFGLSSGLKEAGNELDSLARDGAIQAWADNLSNSLALVADGFGSIAAMAKKAGIDAGHALRVQEINSQQDNAAGKAFWGKIGKGQFGDLFNQDEINRQHAAAIAAEDALYKREVETNNKGFSAVRDSLAKQREQRKRDTYLGKGTYGGSDLARVSKSFGISAGSDQASLLAAQDADLFLTKPGSAGGAGSKTTGKSAADKVKDFIDALKKEAATLGMTSEEHKRYEASLLKMSSAQKTTVDGLLKKITAHKDELAAAQRSNEAWDASFEVIEKLRIEQEDAIKTQRIWLEGMNQEFSLLGKTNEEREIELRLLSLRKAGVNAPGMEKQIHDATYQGAANQYMRAAMTPQELFLEERSRVDKIYKEGGFGSEESALAMEKYSIAVGVVNEKYKSLGDTVKATNSISHDLGMTFASSFEKAILSGGKLRGVLQGLIADLQAMFIRKSVTEPLMASLSRSFGGFGLDSLFSSASTPANIAAFSSMDFGSISAFSTAFADGGIMTSRGRLPLRTYSGGGIANSPQAAIFGEGRTPEAYVPVPSGKIPVQLSGGGGSSVTIIQSFDFRNADSNSESRLRSEAGRIKRETLAELMDNLNRGGSFATATGRK